MTISKLFPMALATFVGATLLLTACKEDENPGTTTGQLNVEITDGPIDDASVKGAFVTVAEVKVDGETFYGFSGKKTINLLNYQQGNVAALGLGDLETGNYHNISLVLDHQTDESGNSPGCYILTDDNVKHSLAASAKQTLILGKNFVVDAGQKTDLVVDFDLRKAIQYQNGSSDKYDFVAAADLQSAVRLVVKSNAGDIQGSCQNTVVNTDKIIVYAYKKGEFNREVEIQTANGIAFKNAVSSAVVGNDGNFKLAFLEAGEYELHLAAYNDDNSDGQLDLQGTLLLNSLTNLENIRLDAGAELQLDILVTGILL